MSSVHSTRDHARSAYGVGCREAVHRLSKRDLRRLAQKRRSSALFRELSGPVRVAPPGIPDWHVWLPFAADPAADRACERLSPAWIFRR